VNVSLEFGAVYRQALLVLSHYSRLEILWVMSISVYIPNTDRCFFILFLLSIYLVFSLRLIWCVLLSGMHVFADYRMWHVSGVTCPLLRLLEINYNRAKPAEHAFCLRY